MPSLSWMTTDPSLQLFAVCLGGTAERANTELHDVVFAVGSSIKDTYDQLIESWFGLPDGLHIDSWFPLQVIEGFRITLRSEPSPDPRKLYFINLGAYVPGELNEVHANTFLVASEKKEVIHRAKENYLKGCKFVHRDYLYEVDECLEVVKVGKYFVHLEETAEVIPFEPTNAYHLIPRERIAAFKQRSASAT